MSGKKVVQEKWSENVIIVDADYIDNVAFNLIVNFERMLMRKLPKADMARWIDCVALDGGVRPMENRNSENVETQVVLIHEKLYEKMDNFSPANYEKELNGKAFKDNLGEFVLNAYAVESITSKDDFLLDAVQVVAEQKEVKRIMVIPDAENGNIYSRLRQVLHNSDDDKRITLFAMQPMAGGNFRQEILGYSLMQALGIRSDELK